MSILLALATSIIVYLLTGFTATGLPDYRVLAQSSSPIADAAKTTGNSALVVAVSLGALVATASVLLTNLIGLSRVSFAMARNGQLPKPAARVSARFRTPYVSILLAGALMITLTFFLDLRQTAAITSFSILATHVVVNLSALRLRKRMPDASTFRAPFYPILPLTGVISCVVLMLSLPAESWIVAAVVVTISLVFYMVIKKKFIKGKNGNVLHLSKSEP